MKMIASIAAHEKLIFCRSIRIFPFDRRRLLSNKSSPHSSATEHTVASQSRNDKLSSSPGSASEAAEGVKSAITSKLTHFTNQATQLAKSKANDAVTKASDTIRTSFHNTKVNAKVKTERYAWEAHRSINRVTKDVEGKIKQKAAETKDKMKESVKGATLSTKEKIKSELSKRMEHFKLPPSLFSGGNSNIKSAKSASQETTALKDALPNNNNVSSQLKSSTFSSLLPNKETILSSASSSLLSKTVSNTTSNLSTQLQNTIHKTFKWLWWWGLAAVGVYGITSTLTKEGVKVLKDVVGSAVGGNDASDDDKSSFQSQKASEAIKDANTVIVESDYVNGGFEVIEPENTSKNDDKHAKGRYWSWISSLGRGWK